MGESFIEIVSAGRFGLVFVALIVVPLAAAFLLEAWASRSGVRTAVVERRSALSGL